MGSKTSLRRPSPRDADERRAAAPDISTSASARSRNQQREATELCDSAVPLWRLQPAGGLRQRGVGKNPRNSRLVSAGAISRIPPTAIADTTRYTFTGQPA